MKYEVFTEFREIPEGRTLDGIAISYTDIATLPWGREQFKRGAFGDIAQADVILEAQHSRGNPLARTGGDLELEETDQALNIRAQIPETGAGNDALTLIRSKVYRGLSIAFIPEKIRQAGDLTIIERAKLTRIAIVERPAYRESRLSVRHHQRGNGHANNWWY